MTIKNFGKILFKSISIIVIVNILFAIIIPMNWLSNISLYNSVVTGRDRFSFGETPNLSYSFTTSNLSAHFASHKVASPKTQGQFRVVVIGNSTVWGHFLENNQTLTGILNGQNLLSTTGKNIQFYNLGYPSISVGQDLLILKESLKYQPDLIIWLVTLEGFPKEKHFNSAIGIDNQNEMSELFPNGFLPTTTPPDILIDQTLFAKRNEINLLIRLQLYGPMWSATGIDHFIPTTYKPRANDLNNDLDFHGFPPSNFTEEIYSPIYMQIAQQLSGDVPIMLVNQPIFIADGENSDSQYNFFYPKWAYDLYKENLLDDANANNWHYYDLSGAVNNDQFTNSAVHLTPKGMRQLSENIGNLLLINNFFQP